MIGEVLLGRFCWTTNGYDACPPLLAGNESLPPGRIDSICRLDSASRTFCLSTEPAFEIAVNSALAASWVVAWYHSGSLSYLALNASTKVLLSPLSPSWAFHQTAEMMWLTALAPSASRASVSEPRAP